MCRRPPPSLGCINTPEYRWSLASSHPHLNSGAETLLPGIFLELHLSPVGSSAPSLPSTVLTTHTTANRAAGLLPSSPHSILPVTPCPRWGCKAEKTCARPGAERDRGARYTTRPRQDGGARWAPAAGASPQPQRSPYLMLTSLSGGDLVARGFYSAR